MGEAWKLADEQLLSPHTILPSQLVEPTTRRRLFAGEQRLMLAILDDAVQTYCKTGSGNPLFRETRDWIESDDRSWLFSFERICEAFELEPECVRRGVRESRRRSRPQPRAVRSRESERGWVRGRHAPRAPHPDHGPR